MKYPKEMYLDSGFYSGDMDGEIENLQEKIVKCRKPHKCLCGCETEIQTGDYALCETGFLDGHPVSCYTMPDTAIAQNTMWRYIPTGCPKIGKIDGKTSVGRRG